MSMQMARGLAVPSSILDGQGERSRKAVMISRKNACPCKDIFLLQLQLQSKQRFHSIHGSEVGIGMCDEVHEVV